MWNLKNANKIYWIQWNTWKRKCIKEPYRPSLTHSLSFSLFLSFFLSFSFPLLYSLILRLSLYGTTIFLYSNTFFGKCACKIAFNSGYKDDRKPLRSRDYPSFSSSTEPVFWNKHWKHFYFVLFHYFPCKWQESRSGSINLGFGVEFGFGFYLFLFFPLFDSSFGIALWFCVLGF